MKKILVLVGSLRKDSNNMKLAQAVVRLAPKGIKLKIFDLTPIPFYNADVEAVAFPDSVMVLRQDILEADGILVMSPEYDSFIPGLLKNAFDWAGRKGELQQKPTSGKPMAIVTATTGGFGGVKAALHLVTLGHILGMNVLANKVAVSKAHEKFDDRGMLIDEHLGEKLVALVTELAGLGD